MLKLICFSIWYLSLAESVTYLDSIFKSWIQHSAMLERLSKGIMIVSRWFCQTLPVDIDPVLIAEVVPV